MLAPKNYLHQPITRRSPISYAARAGCAGNGSWFAGVAGAPIRAAPRAWEASRVLGTAVITPRAPAVLEWNSNTRMTYRGNSARETGSIWRILPAWGKTAPRQKEADTRPDPSVRLPGPRRVGIESDPRMAPWLAEATAPCSHRPARCIRPPALPQTPCVWDSPLMAGITRSLGARRGLSNARTRARRGHRGNAVTIPGSRLCIPPGEVF